MSEQNGTDVVAAGASNSSRDKALSCARWALEKKARGMTILDLGGLSSVTEYFVICSGRSLRQTRAVADYVQRQCKTNGFRPLGTEGTSEGTWILLDYDDVVVHIFHEPTRDMFCLEKLWADATFVDDPSVRELQALVEAEDQEDDDWGL